MKPLIAPDKAPRDMRWRIRAATETCHNRVEERFDTLDFALEEDRVHFMLVHEMAYRFLLPTLPIGSDIQVAILHNIRLLSDYLAPFYITKPNLQFDCPYPAPAGLGTSYVLAGSSLGKAVLAKRWRASTEAATILPAFLEEPTLPAVWKQVMAELTRFTGEQAQAENLFLQASKTFGVFEAAFLQAPRLHKTSAKPLGCSHPLTF